MATKPAGPIMEISPEELGYVIYRQRFTPYFKPKPNASRKNRYFSNPPSMPKLEITNSFTVSPFSTEKWFALYIEAIHQFSKHQGLSNKLCSKLIVISARLCRVIHVNPNARPADVLYQIFVLSYITAYQNLFPNEIALDTWARMALYPTFTLTKMLIEFTRLVMEKDLVDVETMAQVPPLLDLRKNYKSLHYVNVHSKAISTRMVHKAAANFDYQFAGTVVYLFSTRFQPTTTNVFMQKIASKIAIESKPPGFELILPLIDADDWYPDFLGMVFQCLWNIQPQKQVLLFAIMYVGRYLRNVGNYVQQGKQYLLYQLFVSGLLAAETKFGNSPPNMTEWSKKTGLKVEDLKRMEVDFLNRLNWWTMISYIEFQAFQTPMQLFKYFRLSLAEESLVDATKLKVLQNVAQGHELNFLATVEEYLAKNFPRIPLEVPIDLVREVAPTPSTVGTKIMLHYWKFPDHIPSLQKIASFAKTRANVIFLLIQEDRNVPEELVITACDLVLPDNVIYIPKAQGIFEELIEKVGIPTSPFTIYVHEGLITYRGPSFDCPNFDSLPHFVSTIPCVQNHWSSPAIGQPVNIKHILATTEFQDGIVEIQNTVVIRIAKDIGPDWKEFSRLSKLYGTVSFLSAQMGDGPPIVEDIQIIKVRDSNGMFKLLWRLLEYQCIPTYLVMREYHVIHVGSSHQLENHIKKAIQH